MVSSVDVDLEVGVGVDDDVDRDGDVDLVGTVVVHLPVADDASPTTFDPAGVFRR